jgi:hypothetical protein
MILCIVTSLTSSKRNLNHPAINLNHTTTTHRAVVVSLTHASLPFVHEACCAAAHHSAPARSPPPTTASQPAALALSPYQPGGSLRSIPAPQMADFLLTLAARLPLLRTTGPGLMRCAPPPAGSCRLFTARKIRCLTTASSETRSCSFPSSAATSRGRRCPACCIACVLAGAPYGREAMDATVHAVLRHPASEGRRAHPRSLLPPFGWSFSTVRLISLPLHALLSIPC